MGKKAKTIIPADYKPAGLAEPDNDPPEREFPKEKESTGITVVECKVPIEKTLGLPFLKPKNPSARAQEKLC